MLWRQLHWRMDALTQWILAAYQMGVRLMSVGLLWKVEDSKVPDSNEVTRIKR
jgi:hypothetical protein